MIDDEAVLEALRAWAYGHPQPDTPCLVSMVEPYGHGRDYAPETAPVALSPKDFLREVEERTGRGLSFLHFLESQAERYHEKPETFVWRAVKASQAPER